MGKKPTNTWQSLCEDYRKHLQQEERFSLSKQARVLREEKHNLLHTFFAHFQQEPPTPSTLQQWLALPYKATAMTSRATFLSQRRTSNLHLFLQIVLIAFTFPLSLPTLFIWSALTRHTWQFWKTQGQIFIEQLHASITGTHTMLSAAPSSKQQHDSDTTPAVDSTHSIITRFAPAPSLAPQRVAHPHSDATNTPLRPGQALAAALFNPDVISAMATGLPKRYGPEPIIQFIKSTEDGIPDTLQLDLVYELLNTAPATRPDITLEQLQRMQQQHPDIDLNRNLFRYFSIQLLTAIPPVRHVFEDVPFAPRQALPLPAIEVSNSDPTPNLETAPQAKPSLAQRLCQGLLHLLRRKKPAPPELTFDELIKKAYKSTLVYDFEQALDKATTPQQITKTLEWLINYSAIEYELTFEYCREPDRKERLARYMTEVHTYVNQLPENYWLFSDTIQKMEANIRETIELLKQNRLDDAFEHFQKEIPSRFIINAAPYLVAWRNQLTIIFTLLRRPPQLTLGIYPHRAAHMIADTQRLLISNFPKMAAYYDEHTVQPFKGLTDDWYNLGAEARRRIGRRPLENPLTYPELPSRADPSPDIAPAPAPIHAEVDNEMDGVERVVTPTITKLPATRITPRITRSRSAYFFHEDWSQTNVIPTPTDMSSLQRRRSASF